MRSDRIRIKRAFLLGAALLAILACTSQAKVIYVDDDANAPGNGASWQSAYKYLQDALADAGTPKEPVEIRVAQGVYKPDRSAANPEGSRDRTATFRMLSGVTLKGGFAGLGTSDPNIRDVAKYETTLSGDLAGNDVLSEDPEDLVYNLDDGRQWVLSDQWSLLYESTRRENSRHVVTTSGVDQTTVLGGFTITAGNAACPPYLLSPGDEDDWGGGILNRAGSPRVIRCTLIHNSAFELGGGMYNAGSNCSPTLEDCRFIANWTSVGAGAFCNGESPFRSGVYTEMIRCTFEANVSLRWGDAISGDGSTLTATDCQFTGNIGTPGSGRAVINRGGESTFNRCTFSNSRGMAMDHSGTRLTLKDCAFTDNEVGLYLSVDQDATVERCTFIRNQGGGIQGHGANWAIKDCVFLENATAGTGGAIHYDGDIYIPSCKLTLEGCLFAGNVSAGGGGAIYNARIGPAMTNCTFVGNRSPQGGALLITRKGSASLNNCILWANQAQEGPSVYLVEDSKFPSTASISYSLVEGGQASIWQGPGGTVHWGQGNMDVDPCFAEPGHWDPNGTLDNSQDDLFVPGDYHLQSQAGRWDPATQSWVVDGITSPCIDAGDPGDPIGLEPFPNGGRINMGAYGGTPEASKSYFGGSPCETQIPGDINGDCRVDFKDLEIMSRHWLERGYVVPPPTKPRRPIP